LAKDSFDDSDLIKVLDPITPYLKEVVLCGGWTLFVYRKWMLGQSKPLPLRTGDIDVAVPNELPAQAKTLQTLLKTAGFSEELTGSDLLPVMHFTKKNSPYIEFLTPRKGSKDPAVVTVQAGVTAQALRFLEIVLNNPCKVKVPKRDYSVRVPTPAAYLYQKGLSFPYRQKANEKAKDLAYIFELLNNFPELRKSLPKDLITISKNHPDKWLQTFKKNLAQQASSATAEGVQQIIEQQPHPYSDLVRMDATNGRSLFAQAVYSAYKKFLGELS